MQLLYMCYTYWQDNPSLVPVLYPYDKNKISGNFRSNAFLRGFVETMESQMGVKILTGEEIREWLKANTNTNTSVSSTNTAKADATIAVAPSVRANDNLGQGEDAKVVGFDENTATEDESNTSNNIDFKTTEMQQPVGYVLSHVEKLNEAVENHFAFETATATGGTAVATNAESSSSSTNNDHDHDDAAVCRPLRIGILNRKPSSGRSIINAEKVVREIVSEIFDGNTAAHASSSSSSSSEPPVSLSHFERKDFREQVRFFRGTDLLISPHGAQLTGLPFLANKPCTRLLEIFHHDYLLPDYFGTLARDSGIEYSYYVAPSSDSETNQTKRAEELLPMEIEGRDISKDRARAQKKNFCLDPKPIVDAVRDSVRNWCECHHKIGQ